MEGRASEVVSGGVECGGEEAGEEVGTDTFGQWRLRGWVDGLGI